MLQDIVGSLWAVLAFAAVLYAPGYCVAYVANLDQFRQRGFANRSIWAVACSFMVAPLAGYYLGRGFGLGGICLAAGAASLVTGWLVWRRSSGPSLLPRDRWIVGCVLCGWILFVLLMLVEFQIGKKLYFSVVMADQSYRIAFTDAVVRTGVPPANPLYMAGSPAPMRYYYFWYVLCATVVKLAHVTSRQAFIASSVWAGFGLLTCVHLFTTRFFQWSRRQRWIGAGLLLVMGADIVPSLGNAILQPSLNGDIEWWSVDPIDSWPDSLLWVPHHCASAICCLLAFLFIWRSLEDIDSDNRRWSIILVAVAFASSFGLSVYVAFGFTLLVLAWLARAAVRRSAECMPLYRHIAMSSLLSLAMLAPFLWEVLHATHHEITQADAAAPASQTFSLSVRPMIDSGLVTDLPLFATVNRTHPVLLDQMIRLLLLVPGLAMELGVYGLVLVLLLFAKRKQAEIPYGKPRDTALYFTICGLTVTMFLSSAIITNNDFGYRAVMLPQFFLLLLTADVLYSWWTSQTQPMVAATPGRRRWAFTLLALGGAGTVYGAILLRAWLPLVARHPADGFAGLPEDNYQVRELFHKLDRVAPVASVIAFRETDPVQDRKGEVMTPGEFYQRMLVMDAGRQILNAEGKCAVHFGGDPALCSSIRRDTAMLYSLPTPSAAWARAYCVRFGVRYLLLSHWDPGWNARDGWAATLPVLSQEPEYEILQCQGNS